MSNLTQRVLTGLVGAAVVVGAVWAGGLPFAFLVAAAALAAQFELYGLLAAGGTRPLVAYGLLFGVPAALWPLYDPAPLALALGAVGLPVAALYLRRETPLLDAAGTAFGVVYPAALASAILVVRLSEASWLGDDGAPWLTVAVLFTIFAADSFAYIAGRLLGRRKLFERVSPNKTWEGSAGGALGAFAMIAGFKLAVLPQLGWLDVLAVTVACGVASQFGDLAESHFKRSVKIKDSATWLPGHGGLLDRIDAAVVAVPLVALYFETTRGLL